MAKYLLDPLDMDDTDFESGTIDPQSNAAYPHLATSEGLVSFDEIEDTSPLGPASSSVTTIRGLANWLEMRVAGGLFEGRRVLSEEALMEIRRPMILEEPGMAELPPITEDTFFAYSPGWGVLEACPPHGRNSLSLRFGSVVLGQYRPLAANHLWHNDPHSLSHQAWLQQAVVDPVLRACVRGDKWT